MNRLSEVLPFVGAGLIGASIVGLIQALQTGDGSKLLYELIFILLGLAAIVFSFWQSHREYRRLKSMIDQLSAEDRAFVDSILDEVLEALLHKQDPTAKL